MSENKKPKTTETTQDVKDLEPQKDAKGGRKHAGKHAHQQRGNNPRGDDGNGRAGNTLR